MERIEKHSSGRNGGLKKLGTSVALVGLLLTQNPQEAHAQDITNQQTTEEIINNDSTITGEFTPELIEKIGHWEEKSFFLNHEILKKDEEGKEYLCINGNRYYNIYTMYGEDFSGLGYQWLGNFSRTPNGFFIGSIQKGMVGSNGILIQPNGEHYQGGFEEEIFEGYGTLDFPDGSHYDGTFHEGNMEGTGILTRKNGDYYQGEFKNGKRNGEGNMIRKSGNKYSGTWENDNPVKDPNKQNNPVIVGKGTYTFYGNDKTTIEVSKGERPKFISVQDKKDKENWDKKRGVIVYIVKESNGKKTYELHSWNRNINYSEIDDHYVFSTQDGAELKFHTNIGEKKAKAIANLINSVMSMVKNNDEGYYFYAFDYLGDTLQAQYRNAFFDTNLVKDIPGKIGISAKEFSDWLNHYRKDKPDWLYSY